MKINKIVVGRLRENCYILSKDEKVIIIDPGDEYEKIKEEMKEKELIAVLVTHHHFDHVGALSQLLDEYKVPLYDNQTKETEIKIGPFQFEIIKTKGHTEDSVTFYFKKENTMFTGDFLFKESIGRMDLGGNIYDMEKSIEKIKKYPNVTFYPGHGDKTTLDYEIKNNPYFHNFP